MARTKIVILALPLILFSLLINAQVIGFRLAANSSVLLSEFGPSDVPHPSTFALSPAQSTDRFSPQPTLGFEGEILFQIAPSSFFGIEFDYTHLKGRNNEPLYYNYFLTPYFSEFQDSFNNLPVKHNTTLLNLAVNYKYFFFKEQVFKPFIKLTGVVAFVGTDFKYQEASATPGDDILYSRGTLNSNQKKWPVFHMGGGIGFSYDISDRIAFQVDGTATVVNSGIVDGVPNFTYIQENSQDLLRYNRRLSLTTQISAGLVYSIEVESGGTGGGRTTTDRPFYRKKK